MFRKSIAAALTALAITATPTASAESQDFDVFFDLRSLKGAPDWEVYGLNDKEVGKTCWARLNFHDGSRFFMAHNAAETTMRLYFKNVDWKFTEDEGTEGKVRLNFFRGSTFLEGGEITARVARGDTIEVPDLDFKMYQLLDKATRMVVIMPGKISNMSFPLTGSGLGIKELGKCLTASRKGLKS